MNESNRRGRFQAHGSCRQGQGSLQQADTTSIDKTTVIKADATQSGNGGNVVVWSDQLTDFAVTISATGGAQGGDGGQVEVFSHGLLGFSGSVDLLAPGGGHDDECIAIRTGRRIVFARDVLTQQK